jgi:hypothetical protein
MCYPQGGGQQFFSFPAAPALPLKLMTSPLGGCDEIWILCSSGKNNIVDERDIVFDTKT